MSDDRADGGGPEGAPWIRRRPVAALALAAALIALGVLRPAGDDHEAAAPRVPLHLLGGALATAAVLGVAATFPGAAGATGRGASGDRGEAG